ncbi:MAG TPA: Fic family protein [Candidatus Saccharimonadales bacterium]|nr:Fic family protein [Candidatus Saccharimonadales bacterium]
MYIPEYSISSKTLKNIASIEYSKALIENSTILTHWEKQLEKEALARTIAFSWQFLGLNLPYETVKKIADGVEKSLPTEVLNLTNALQEVVTTSNSKDLDEQDLRNLHKAASQNLLPTSKVGVYRSGRIKGATDPEEILAEMVELIDWYNSLDAQETHPIIKAGILKARLEMVIPFEKTNYIISNLATQISLKAYGYDIRDFISLEPHYYNSKFMYEQLIQSLMYNSPDLTRWLEFFTETMADELSNIKDKVLLLARDTKVAKVSGRARLTERQERIVEHLQDYGLLQNKDFTVLFPGISEDSILRDLKVLLNEGIIIKTGSTKSSRYELH